MDREKVINGLECCFNPHSEHSCLCRCADCPYNPPEDDDWNQQCQIELNRDALAMLKEQEAVVKQWTKEIADNQLAHAPDELDRENWDYKKGIWDGLQIAWNIISEGR